MFAKILGTIWILLGIIWTIKPQMLRRRLIKKMNRKMKWAVYGFILVFMSSLLGVVIKAQGFWLKIAALTAIFFVIKGIFSVIAKTSDKISGFWTEQPLAFFRIWGLVVFISGLLLFLTK